MGDRGEQYQGSVLEMKVKATTGQVSLEDKDGETVIISLGTCTHRSDDTVEISVSQFKGQDIEWQRSIPAEALVEYVRKVGKPQPE